MNLRKSAFISLAVAAFGIGGLALTASAQQDRPHHMPGERLEALDTNGDGNISREEVDAVGAERFAAADTNGDGAISTEEFAAAADAMEAQRRAERQARMFEHLDKDSDGVLSSEELSMRVDHMFSRVDKDGDGVVTEAEREDARATMRERWGERHGDHGPRGPRPGADGGTQD